jgi:hypothetical protein
LTNPPMIGATFVYFDCRGCMASDHRFEWVGVGDHFALAESSPGQERWRQRIVIRVVKRKDTGDFRDQDLGFESYFPGDGTIQLLAPGLYVIFK